MVKSPPPTPATRKARVARPEPDHTADLLWSYLSEIAESDPAALVLGRLDGEDHTILFGDGSTGKGVVSAWWVARLTRDHRDAVVILDYEAHARFEWRPRVRRFGGDLDRVIVAQPDRAIWGIVAQVRALADELRSIEGVGRVWLVVDSIGYACLGEEIEKSATATKYSKAIVEIGLPALSLAHTTKTDANPQHPFGSVFWSNGARVTIAMSGYRDQPRRLENKKTNQRGAFDPVELDWSWSVGDAPTPADLIERQASKATPESRMISALWAARRPLTMEEIAQAVNADEPEVPLETLRSVLKRDRKRTVRVFVEDGAEPNRVRTALGPPRVRDE
jgi:hypothetical protein